MTINVALFPLSQMILPGGRMRLRVFEPRYQRLVREAAAGQRAFASALLNPYVAAEHPQRIFALVTLVNIVDFDQLDDGLLCITIEGVSRHTIVKRWQEADQLHVASIEALAAWPLIALSDEDTLLVNALMKVYADNPELATLYCNQQVSSATELAMRWLEILTMPATLKHQLQAQPTPQLALETLRQWLQEPLQPN